MSIIFTQFKIAHKVFFYKKKTHVTLLFIENLATLSIYIRYKTHGGKTCFRTLVSFGDIYFVVYIYNPIFVDFGEDISQKKCKGEQTRASSTKKNKRRRRGGGGGRERVLLQINIVPCYKVCTKTPQLSSNAKTSNYIAKAKDIRDLQDSFSSIYV